ncbi:MAG: sugar nucleotidyltransferase [Candidatus Undinarchaeales archaeon]
MIGLVPAAGEGTRLRPWTKALPKEMLQVGDKPIIEHVLQQFKEAGIEKVFIIVGYRKEAIMNYLGNGSDWGMKIAYLFQEDKKGLAHAIYQGDEFIDEPFVVMLGDTLLNPERTLKKVLDFHEKKDSDVTLFLEEVEDPSRFGVVETDENGKVIDLEEKPENPKSNLAIIGLYVFSPEVFKFIEKTKPGKKGELQITDSIKLMVEAGKKVYAMKNEGTWFDIGTKESYMKANKFAHSDNEN